MNSVYGLVVNVCVMFWIVLKRAQYYYEFSEGYALEEHCEPGEHWGCLCAPESEAEVRYIPEERRAVPYIFTLHEDTRR